MIRKFAVIGHPVAHSKSPEIHQAFARQVGLRISYEKVLAPLDQFAQTVVALRQQGFAGANVTVPFKFEAYDIAMPTPRAREAGAVNTLVFSDNDATLGDNTDGAGMVRDISHNLGVEIKNKRVLLVGAGGAAEGVLFPLLDAQPQALVITNRTIDKAQAMVNKGYTLRTLSPDRLLARTFESLAGLRFDIVINATSTGLSDQALPLPAGIFSAGALAYDMMYAKETPFTVFAKHAGVQQVEDGLGMLVEQAAEAFLVWHGVRPQTAPVIADLRA